MAVTGFWYGNAFTKAFNKEINWASDTIKVMLTTSTYTPDQDNHIYKSSVTNEVVGTGYTAGGLTLTSKTAIYTGSSNTLALSAANVTWASSSIVARTAVIYDSTGTDATSPLLGYVPFGADVTSSAGPFVITWDPTGIFTITVS